MLNHSHTYVIQSSQQVCKIDIIIVPIIRWGNWYSGSLCNSPVLVKLEARIWPRSVQPQKSTAAPSVLVNCSISFISFFKLTWMVSYQVYPFTTFFIQHDIFEMYPFWSILLYFDNCFILWVYYIEGCLSHCCVITMCILVLSSVYPMRGFSQGTFLEMSFFSCSMKACSSVVLFELLTASLQSGCISLYSHQDYQALSNSEQIWQNLGGSYVIFCTPPHIWNIP